MEATCEISFQSSRSLHNVIYRESLLSIQSISIKNINCFSALLLNPKIAFINIMDFLSYLEDNPIFESTYIVRVTLLVAVVTLISFQLKSETIRKYVMDMYSFVQNQLFKVYYIYFSISLTYLLGTIIVYFYSTYKLI